MQRRPPKMRTGSPHDPAIPLTGGFSWPEGADGSEDIAGRSSQWSRGADAAVGQAVGPGQRVDGVTSSLRSGLKGFLGGRKDHPSLILPLWSSYCVPGGCGQQWPQGLPSGGEPQQPRAT